MSDSGNTNRTYPDLLEKPEGFDFRNARSERNDDNGEWLPQDALYSFACDLREGRVSVDRLLIVYQEAPAEGEHTDSEADISFRVANCRRKDYVYMASVLQKVNTIG